MTLLGPDGPVTGLLIVVFAFWGIGLPIAWLLPAPAAAPWTYRLAVAPLYSVVVVWIAAQILALVGVPLHPLMLVGAGLALWATAWLRTHDRWQLRSALGSSVGPILIIGLAGGLWTLILRGYGLYLPNRDFKNHAYWVAMVSWLRTGDPNQVLRPAPVDDPVTLATYPLGLHTLLGWALPTRTWNSMPTTAGAGVIAATILLPLALIALSHAFLPGQRLPATLAGLSAVCLPGLTYHFAYGSTVILLATALYVAGLCTALLASESPGPPTWTALGLVLFGLFIVHVAEAAALAVVVVASLVVQRLRTGRSRGRLVRETWIAVTVCGLIGLAVVIAWAERLASLAEGASGALAAWDRRGFLHSVTSPFAELVGGSVLGSILIVSASIAGAVIWIRERRSPVLILALVMPWVLAVVTTWAAVPDGLRLISAPWYGEGSRVALLAAGPVIVLSSLAVLRAAQHAAKDTGSLLAHATGASCVALALLLLLGGALDGVRTKRGNLEATLAGAADTPDLGRELAARLSEGETVLNFEADGTANLFAAARIPVLAAQSYSSKGLSPDRDLPWLLDNLIHLDDPEVAAALDQLNVKYLALGTTSLYWLSSVGYSPDRLQDQSHLHLELTADDMMILRYTP